MPNKKAPNKMPEQSKHLPSWLEQELTTIGLAKIPKTTDRGTATSKRRSAFPEVEENKWYERGEECPF